MWERAELKYRAKNVLRSCFWAAVVVALVTGILTGSFSGNGRNTVTIKLNEHSYNQIQESGQGMMGSAKDMIGENISGIFEKPQSLISKILGAGFGVIIFGMGIFVAVLGLAIGILVGNPIQVGSNRFFMSARERSTPVGEMFYVFRQGYFWNVVLIMLVMNVKILLWSLLLVVPGIVKSYEYMMIPYILAENPGISMSEAFDLSREMTDGEKMNMFILSLSFIPWNLLAAATRGLAGVFWVNPYVAATNAELYAVLREQVLASGYAGSDTLPGF